MSLLFITVFLLQYFSGVSSGEILQNRNYDIFNQIYLLLNFKIIIQNFIGCYLLEISDILKFNFFFYNLDTSKVSFKECDISAYDRIDCGYYGIGLEECQSRGCCWQPSDLPGVNWCYHSNSKYFESATLEL